MASRLLRTALVLVVILLVHFLLALLTLRLAEFYLLAVTVLVVPASYWFRYRFRVVCAVFTCGTFLIAATPVDVLVRSDGQGLRVRLLPASHGPACEDHERFACFGCPGAPYPASRAVVISH